MKKFKDITTNMRYLVMMVIPIIIVAYFGYFYVVGHVKLTVDASYRNQVDQIATRIQSEINRRQKQSYAIVNQLPNEEEKSTKVIRSYKLLDDTIQEISVMNLDENRVITSQGNFDIQYYYNHGLSVEGIDQMVYLDMQRTGDDRLIYFGKEIKDRGVWNAYIFHVNHQLVTLWVQPALASVLQGLYDEHDAIVVNHSKNGSSISYNLSSDLDENDAQEDFKLYQSKAIDDDYQVILLVPKGIANSSVNHIIVFTTIVLIIYGLFVIVIGRRMWRQARVHCQIRGSNPLNQNDYFNQLIQALDSDDEASIEAIDRASMIMDKPYFTCAIIDNHHDISLYRLKKVSNGYDCRIYQFQRDERLIAIINYADKDQVDAFYDHIEHDDALSLNLSIGRAYRAISELRKSFQEAQIVFDNRHETVGKVFKYDQLKSKHASYYYPFSYQMKFVDYIIQGNAYKANEIFLNLYENNINEDNISIINFFLDIELTLIKVIRKLGYEERIDAILINESLKHNVQDKKDDILRSIQTICDMKHQDERIETNPKWDAMIQYINENYNDSMLSLDKIADKFSINASYFSRSFKEHMKTTFLKYINNLRVKKAIEFIENGENLKKIAGKVGYNDDTFRRAFKRSMGVSPSRYKEICALKNTN